MYLFLANLCYLLAFLLLSGCGPGLCVGNNNGGCPIDGSVTPRLILSGLEGLTIRKNDCYPVTLSAVDAAGLPMTEITAQVSISASTGVVIYSSLEGCQTYDSAFEKSAYVLSPSAPSVVFYFRSDTEGAVSLSASTAASNGLADASQPMIVEYTAFDGASGPSGFVSAVVSDGAGGAFIGGKFASFGETFVGGVARVRSDGTLNTAFAIGGQAFDTTAMISGISSMLVQSDGKLVVAGDFSSYDGTTRGRIARLNNGGGLDTAFAPAGFGYSSGVSSIAIQSDGKIVVGGAYGSYNSVPSTNYLTRLNADGSLDTSFAPTGTGFNSQVYAVTLQADQRVIAGGSFTSYNGTSRPRIARVNTNGSLDTSFVQTGSGLDGTVFSMALQTDGKIIVVGDLTSYNGTSRPNVARINSDGTLDNSFAPTGSGLDGRARTAFVQSDGKIVVGGEFSSYNGTAVPYVARLHSDGTLDTSFAPVGSGLNGAVMNLFRDTTGKYLVCGDFTAYNGASANRIALLSASGQLDPSFAQTQSGLNGEVQSLALQSDGQLIATGYFTLVDGVFRPNLARFATDGSLDTSFPVATSGFNSNVNAIAFQNDGKGVFGGFFGSYDGTSRGYIARLNTNGGLDSSFATVGSGLNNIVFAVAIPTDGKILVGGSFTSYNGTSRARIARLLTSGALDTSFSQTGTGFNSDVLSIQVLSSGKILVAGGFTSYNGTARSYIARLNNDGSLDTTFSQTGSGLSGLAHAIETQEDQKILVGGNFTAYDGTARAYLARLNSDGTLDNSFAQTGSGLDWFVSKLAIQKNNRILAIGYFSAYNGTTRSRLVRLNSDGSLDTSFLAAGGGANTWTQALVTTNEGKVVVGGQFTTFLASTVNYLVRLTYIGTLD